MFASSSATRADSDLTERAASTMIDLIRPQYVNKLRAAQQHLAHVQQLGLLEQREFLREAEREVGLAQKKLDDYDADVRASQTSAKKAGK